MNPFVKFMCFKVQPVLVEDLFKSTVLIILLIVKNASISIVACLAVLMPFHDHC